MSDRATCLAGQRWGSAAALSLSYVEEACWPATCSASAISYQYKHAVFLAKVTTTGGGCGSQVIQVGRSVSVAAGGGRGGLLHNIIRRVKQGKERVLV